jgi:demethylmenaquinone methyltransferase/2-methoxy-6-polyprenyl-1,4-benzoquinol methylase
MTDHQVRRMFERTASTYDLQNRILSAMQDRHWRDVFVRYLRLHSGSVMGDMAIGTGDIAIAACRRYPGVRVVGVDFSPGMLRIANRKIRVLGLSDRIELRLGDLRDIPLEDACIDAVTLSFGVRNIKERERVLRECFRVLRPGGRLQVMEMAIPQRGLVAGAYRLYFDHLMPAFGNMLSRTDYAYHYLKLSVYSFPSDAQFLSEISEAGFGRARVIPITFGTAKIYCGEKR